MRLRLEFVPSYSESVEPDDLKELFRDIDALYRVASAADSVNDLERLPILFFEYRQLLAVREGESARNALISASSTATASMPSSAESFDRGDLRRGFPPESRMRVERVKMNSPLELILYLPAAYAVGRTVDWFLASIEARFNAVERIKAERADLKATQEERGADEIAARLRRAELEDRWELQLLTYNERSAFRIKDGNLDFASEKEEKR